MIEPTVEEIEQSVRQGSLEEVRRLIEASVPNAERAATGRGYRVVLKKTPAREEADRIAAAHRRETRSARYLGGQTLDTILDSSQVTPSWETAIGQPQVVLSSATMARIQRGADGVDEVR